jgi:hypothetical protein
LGLFPRRLAWYSLLKVFLLSIIYIETSEITLRISGIHIGGSGWVFVTVGTLVELAVPLVLTVPLARASIVLAAGASMTSAAEASMPLAGASMPLAGSLIPLAGASITSVAGASMSLAEASITSLY